MGRRVGGWMDVWEEPIIRQRENALLVVVS